MKNAVTEIATETDMDALIFFANDWARLTEEQREAVAEVLRWGTRAKPDVELVERAARVLQQHAPRAMKTALRAWLDAADEKASGDAPAQRVGSFTWKGKRVTVYLHEGAADDLRDVSVETDDGRGIASGVWYADSRRFASHRPGEDLDLLARITEVLVETLADECPVCGETDCETHLETRRDHGDEEQGQ